MKNALNALFSVAEELSELAKSSMPKLRKGESISAEWLKDGVYYRETILDGATYQTSFDFKKRVATNPREILTNSYAV